MEYFPITRLGVSMDILWNHTFGIISLNILCCFADMATSLNSGCPSVRVIIQQCLSARLQVQPPTENDDAQWVEVGVLGKDRLPNN